MSMFNGRYRIESARLPGWDYTLGWYFITVCTHQRRRSLSTVVGDKVRLSPIGAIVAVPLAAVVQAFVVKYLEQYRAQHGWPGPDEDPGSARPSEPAPAPEPAA